MHIYIYIASTYEYIYTNSKKSRPFETFKIASQ